MRELSLELTRATGRPTLAVDLEKIPHAPQGRGTGNFKDARFTEAQLDDRAAYLERQARATLPQANAIWDQWQWRAVSAGVCAPNTDTMVISGGSPEQLRAAEALPGRLVGDQWVQAAIIFMPDRRWSEEAEWRNKTGLGSHLEYYPRNGIVRASDETHETAHVLQRRRHADKIGLAPAAPAEFHKAETANWIMELDADRLPVQDMRRAAQRLKKQAARQKLSGTALQANRQARRDLFEGVASVKHARALAGFLVSTPRYWLALALDNPKKLGLLPTPQQRDEKAVAYFYQAAGAAAEKSQLAGYELRWRVAAQMEGAPLRENSAILQNKVKDWLANPGPSKDPDSHRWELNYWFSDILSRSKQPRTPDEPKKSFHWAAAADVTKSIPALKAVLASGVITDPLTQRNGELVVRAAHYFKPGLRQEPVPPVVAPPQHLTQKAASLRF